MLNDLTLVHRRKPAAFAADRDFPVWETCLRSLAFVRGPLAFEPSASDEVYTQQAAYQFLLEIICGLHSPIVGETEVFGQFKNFSTTWVDAQPGYRPLLQRVLNEAKNLRAQHLSHQGTQSYGSWLRKNLQAERVHILGGGQLVQEILPYLAKHAEVVVHVRQPEKAQALVGPRVRVESLSASAFDRGALVVAAPLSASAVRDWLAQRTALQIFDLRDSSAADAVSTAAISLQDIFAQIEHTRERLKPVVANVKAEIVRLAHAYVAQEKVRPQGWDDLCA